LELVVAVTLMDLIAAFLELSLLVEVVVGEMLMEHKVLRVVLVVEELM
jgi:hypothetical protein